MRKEAIRLYGLERLHAMNQIRLKPSAIPRFAQGGLVHAIQSLNRMQIRRGDLPGFGGLVRSLVIPRIPQVAFADSGAVSPQAMEMVRLDLTTNNRPAASITTPRDQVRGLVDALKELQRGLV
ncbi:MAG: hypothetical protein HQL64_01320 [Magnetococcales bacterium]|nr:hypothetical protein [Magnetococcales bacterium]